MEKRSRDHRVPNRFILKNPRKTHANSRKTHAKSKQNPWKLIYNQVSAPFINLSIADLAPLSLFSSHRKNWFAARCECLHLIKKNSQCSFAYCEFFLIRCKYSQRAANRFLRWLEALDVVELAWNSTYLDDEVQKVRMIPSMQEVKDSPLYHNMLLPASMPNNLQK